MSEIERLARIMVKAMHGNVGPDTRVAPQYGIVTAGGFAVIPQEAFSTPLWRVYEPAARAIVDDAERKAEMDRAERDY